MKRDEIQKLMEKPDAELKTLLTESQDSLRTLRFDLNAGKVKNVAALRTVKKTIARILTALRARELGLK